MRKLTSFFLLCLLGGMSMTAQKQFELKSPDGKVATSIQAGETLTYDIQVDGQQVMAPSAISMKLSTGKTWGENAKVKKARRSEINAQIASPFTRQTSMQDHCNVLTLDFSGNYSVEFRAYDDGICYRFVSKEKKPFQVISEGVEYQFANDPTCVVPYVPHFNANNAPEVQFKNSFLCTGKSATQAIVFFCLAVKKHINVYIPHKAGGTTEIQFAFCRLSHVFTPPSLMVLLTSR